MDFDDSPEEIALRAEVRAWLDEHAVRRDPEALAGMRTYRTRTEAEGEAFEAQARVR